SGAEPGADEQFEEVFQRPQGSWRPLPEGAGELPGDQQRYRVGLSEREAPEGGGEPRSSCRQSAAAGLMTRSVRTRATTPSSSASLLGTYRYSVITFRSRACPRRRIVRAWEPSVSTICRAAAVMRPVLMLGRLRSADTTGMCMRSLTCCPFWSRCRFTAYHVS